MKGEGRMKKLAFGALLVTALALVATTGSVASKSNRIFVAHLSGANELPPVDTKAQGQAILKLNKDGTAIDYKLVVANIEGVTQSHIHCGAGDVNGPVVAFLFGPMPAGVSTNGVLATGTITGVIALPDSPECPGGVADLDDLIAKLQAGEAYANVHTLANPPGEIRGQLD
jgi:hypothetical protein